MPIATPEKLKAASIEINRPAIKNREDFATFMQTSGLNDIIFKHLATRDGVNGIGRNTYFIGGSQAWKQWAYHSLPHGTHLSPMEQSSLVAGNADVFYLSDSAKGCDELMCDLHDIMIKNMKKECDAALKAKGFPYKLNVKCYGFKSTSRQCTMDDKPTTYTIFPAFSIMVHLDAGVSQARTRARQVTRAQEEAAPFHDKLVLYLECSHVPGLSIPEFEKTFLIDYNGFSYLNYLGLTTFALMISENRSSSKGIDVDSLRRDVLGKVYPMVTVYEHVVNAYNHIFHTCPSIYNENYVNAVKMMAMKARSMNVNALCETFEMWLIEKMRPYINAFIHYTEQEIAIQTKHDSFMFVVGGDAMRRYKKSISVTKDIDSKVYVGKSTRTSTVIDIVRKNLSRLVVFLIRHKAQIFADIPGDLLKFPNVENGVSADIKFITNSISNLQFRLREIKKCPTLPVNLFSVDYRAYFQGTYLGHKFNIKYDIPILDVAVQNNKKNKPQSEIVHRTHNHLPVASLEFLLDDLQTTYGDDKLTAQRIFARKRGKDMERFYKLRNIYQRKLEGATHHHHSSSSKSQSIMGLKVNLDGISKEAFDYIHAPDHVAAHYEHAFKKLYDNKKVYKFKMPFDGTLLGFEVPKIVVREYEVDEIVVPRSPSVSLTSISRDRPSSSSSVDNKRRR